MSAANIGSGFCRTSIPFDICRAIAGIGGALILPNAAGLLGRAYPPGRMRTIGFSILGALAPAGSICGGIMAALISQTIGVRWCFFITCVTRLSLSDFLLTRLLQCYAFCWMRWPWARRSASRAARDRPPSARRVGLCAGRKRPYAPELLLQPR